MRRPLMAVLFLIGGVPLLPSFAGPASADAWTQRKCDLYTASWNAVSGDDLRGRKGIGEAFVANHEAFIASNCTRDHDVCPSTPEELELAEVLTIMSMNEGMASTFVPFRCADENGNEIGWAGQ